MIEFLLILKIIRGSARWSVCPAWGRWKGGGPYLG
ncbi:MAG: hypothetical protein ACJAVK_003326, partial [Akkermansiaceae bacterium]